MRLRERIDIEKFTAPADDEGFIDKTDSANWNAVATMVAAKIRQKRGREGTREERIEASQVFYVTIYSRGLASGTHRFLWKGHGDDILTVQGPPRFVDPDERYEEYVCTRTDAD